MEKEDRLSLLFLLLSHHKPEKLHRTIRIGLGEKNIYLCARCTGINIGIVSVCVAWFFNFNLPTWSYLPSLFILPAPSMVDWVTQSCKLRESRNSIRICTGFLLGICWGLFFLLLVKGMFFLFLYALAILGGYILLIYIIALKTKFLDTYFG